MTDYNKLARDVVFHNANWDSNYVPLVDAVATALREIVDSEREECAKLCKGFINPPWDYGTVVAMVRAIRERGEVKRG